MLLLQLLRHRGQLLELTERGIENTLVFLNLFAIVLVLPVKCIPWGAVKYADLGREPYIRVNTGKVNAGVIARLVLWVVGYHFCYSFVRPAVTAEEIKQYMGTA